MQTNEKDERDLVARRTTLCNELASKISAVVDIVAEGIASTHNLKIFLSMAVVGFVDRKDKGGVSIAWRSNEGLMNHFVNRTMKKLKVGVRKRCAWHTVGVRSRRVSGTAGVHVDVYQPQPQPLPQPHP